MPEWTSNLAAEYRRPVANDRELFARVDWRHQGDFLINEAAFTFDIHAVDLVNARVGVESDRWSVSAYVKNALGEQYASDPGFLGYFVRVYSLPRSIGAEYRYRF